MSAALAVWLVIGLFALLLALPFVSYLVAKFAQMGKLAGTRSFLSFKSKEKADAVKD